MPQWFGPLPLFAFPTEFDVLPVFASRPGFNALPLFGPVPWGTELAVILLIAVLMFGVPLVLLGGGFLLYRQSRSDRPAGEELEALRREVEALREEVRQLDDDEE